MSNIKKDCYWYVTRGGRLPGCRALYTLQCRACGNCSFYETENALRARMAKYHSLNWVEPLDIL